MKKYIITGASGFIGKRLLAYLVNYDYLVYAVVRDADKLKEYKKHPKVTVLEISMENIHRLSDHEELTDADCCIHLAWDGASGDGRSDYVTQTNNIRLSCDLLDALSRISCKRFVGVGTLTQREITNESENEDEVPRGACIYGIAKNTVQIMTRTMCGQNQMEHIWCVVSNLYGIGDHTDNLFNHTAKALLSGNDLNYTSCEQDYDFANVDDAVCGLVSVAEKGRHNRSYYIGSGKPMRLKDYLDTIVAKVGNNQVIHYGKDMFTAKPLPKETYSIDKIVNDTGWEPKVSFEEGAKKTIEWLKDEMEEP